MAQDGSIRWSEVTDDRAFPMVVRKVQQSSGVVHSHEFFEIVYIVEGFSLHSLDEENMLLLPGDIIVMRPGNRHKYRGRRTASIVNLLFMPEALGSELEEIRTLPGMEKFFNDEPSAIWEQHTNLGLEERQQVLGLLQEMIVEREDGKLGWVLRSRALLIELLVILSRLFSARFSSLRTGAAGYVGYVNKAMEVIEAEYARDLSIAEVAGRVGVSADHLTRQFNRLLGITPSEYLRRFRFARAIELLRRRTPVGDVCRQTGFAHMSHFSREFKATFGMTPSEYARKNGRAPEGKVESISGKVPENS